MRAAAGCCALHRDATVSMIIVSTARRRRPAMAVRFASVIRKAHPIPMTAAMAAISAQVLDIRGLDIKVPDTKAVDMEAPDMAAVVSADGVADVILVAAVAVAISAAAAAAAGIRTEEMHAHSSGGR